MDPIENLNKLMDEQTARAVVAPRPFYVAYEHVIPVDKLDIDQIIVFDHASPADEFGFCAKLAEAYELIEEGGVMCGSIVGGMTFSEIPNPIAAMTVYEAVGTRAMYPNAVIFTTFSSELLSAYHLDMNSRQDKLRDTLTNLKIPFMEIEYDDPNYTSECTKYIHKMQDREATK